MALKTLIKKIVGGKVGAAKKSAAKQIPQSPKKGGAVAKKSAKPVAKAVSAKAATKAKAPTKAAAKKKPAVAKKPAKTAPKVVARPKAKAAPRAKAKAKPAAKPKARTKPAAKAKPKAKPAAKPVAKAKVKAKAPQKAKLTAKPVAKAKPAAKPKAVAKVVAKPVAKAKPDAKPAANHVVIPLAKQPAPQPSAAAQNSVSKAVVAHTTSHTAIQPMAERRFRVETPFRKPTPLNKLTPQSTWEEVIFSVLGTSAKSALSVEDICERALAVKYDKKDVKAGAVTPKSKFHNSDMTNLQVVCRYLDNPSYRLLYGYREVRG